MTLLEALDKGVVTFLKKLVFGGYFVKEPNPLSLYSDFGCIAGAADNDVIYAPSDISDFSEHMIENESGVVVDVFTSINGTDFSTSPASVYLLDALTGDTVTQNTVPNNKVGVLRGRFKKIEVRQAAAGAIASDSVRISHGIK